MCIRDSYHVDALSVPAGPIPDQPPPGGMVVTQRLPPFSTMSMTWVPARAGNWLFHCHFQLHVARDAATEPNAARGESHQNHAMTGMTGLVMGIVVKPRPGARADVPPPSVPVRRLRLVAVQDSAFPDSAPSMHFVLEEPATHRPAWLK